MLHIILPSTDLQFQLMSGVAVTFRNVILSDFSQQQQAPTAAAYSLFAELVRT